MYVFHFCCLDCIAITSKHVLVGINSGLDLYGRMGLNDVMQSAIATVAVCSSVSWGRYCDEKKLSHLLMVIIKYDDPLTKFSNVK